MVGPTSRATWAIRSLVEVLPDDPVMPTTRSSGSLLSTCVANRPRATTTSATTHGGSTDGAGGEGERPRPGAKASVDEVVPVHPFADDAGEQAAGFDVARVDEGPGRDRRGRVGDVVEGPADHVGDLGDRHGDHRGVPPSRPVRRASASTTRSSKGRSTPSTSCPVSWPLPATTTAPPGDGTTYGDGDGSGPVGLDDQLGGRAGGQGLVGPDAHRGQDRERVLRARVVAGEDRDVGTVDRGRAHGRALVRVAVPAAAEHDDDRVRSRPSAPRRAGSRRPRGCARSRRPRGTAARRRPAPSDPGRRPGRRCPRAACSAGTPATTSVARAARALATLKDPGRQTETWTDSPLGPSARKVDPSAPSTTS